ncbi:MAG: hypothetical protein ACD_41C00303G0003 [uncultured bacterium]|nr:MAG: hypothetical protein ACD_41C00303G0003 [uncultured bacterium]
MNKVRLLFIVCSVSLSALFIHVSTAQASVSCTCSGSASINALGQTAAAAAGYTQADFASACTSGGGTAAGWTCSISNLTGSADNETQCTSATPESVAEMAGLPSAYSAFYSASGSCRLTDDESSGGVTGWRYTLVPKDCQDENGCDICEITKVFTNAADIIGAFLSALSLLMFIIGGLFWIFSGGVESRIETGKKILIGTVSGLAVVFIAWFAVNVIVRTASLSGGTQTAKVFTREWWSFEGCYPDLPITCEGALVGEACLASPCKSGNYQDPQCICWRALATDGDSPTCDGTDVSSPADVDDASSNKSKQCVCADGCTLFANTDDGASYTCTSGITESNEDSYIVRDDLSCSVANTVCAKRK